MKSALLSDLESFEKRIRALRRDVRALDAQNVNAERLRMEASEIANTWVEELRSPLEHRFAVDPANISDMAGNMRRLFHLSRGRNRCTSYVETLEGSLKKFHQRFVLPVQEANSEEDDGQFNLQGLVDGLQDADESDYLSEAIECANAGFRRASIVMGWCAAVDRIHRKIQLMGFETFNTTSTAVKTQVSGRNKRWNKEFNVTTLSELQAVFDTDLIVMLEAMELIDSNQADRLRSDFQYRNQSAHPGDAPILDPHLVAFFHDIAEIVLNNQNFSV